MKRTILDVDLKDKKVLVRVDFNVPLNEYSQITDDRRIMEALPTIRHLLKQGAKVIVCSHLGRPKGVDKSFSLYPVAQRLIDLLVNKVYFALDVVGKDAIAKADKLKPGELLLLENLRFEQGEEENDIEFVHKLASLADFYVNDAFGTAHRKHASTYGVAKILPNAVGFLMGKEVSVISQVIENPEKPFVAILGGGKISDKINVIKNLLNIVDCLIIGGGMSYTFLKAQGYEIGNSIVDEEKIDLAKELLEEAKEKKVKIYLPIDNIVADVYSPSAKGKKTKTANIPADKIALDIGPKTIKLFSSVIKKSKTIVWNGPLGVYEFKNFEKGTKKIAAVVGKVNGVTLIGGGDVGAAIKKFNMSNKVTHISTGGGASLKMLEGVKLPGVEIISEKE